MTVAPKKDDQVTMTTPTYPCKSTKLTEHTLHVTDIGLQMSARNRKA